MSQTAEPASPDEAGSVPSPEVPDPREPRSSAGAQLDRLRAVSQELLNDFTVESVVATVVRRGLSLIGAFGGALWELGADDVLRMRGCVGYPDEVYARWQELPLDADAPGPEAARTGQMVVLRSVAERDARYPALSGRATVGEVFIAAPLVVQGRTIGLLGLGFERAHELDDDGLVFINAAAAQCAAAMHRALVVEAQQRSLAQAHESARRLAVLQRVTAALADVRDSAGTVDFIFRELSEALGAQQLALNVLDESGTSMRTVRHHGMLPGVDEQFAEFPFAPGLPATDALLQRRAVIMRTATERLAQYPQLAGLPSSDHAWICLPLVIADRGIGTLSLSLPQPQAFPPEDVEFLTALADQCGHALERARLLESQIANRARLELLAEAGRIFTAPLDVQLTSVQFCQLIVGRVADAVSVHLREPDGSYLVAAAEHVNPAQIDVLRRVSTQLPRSISETFDRVLERRSPVVLRSAALGEALSDVGQSELRAAVEQHPPTSTILLPLVSGGRALGVLVVTTEVGGRPALSSDERDHLEELAGRLALAIDSARLLRQQIEIAHTLQRSLLPASLPRVPGAEVAVRYLPGAEGVDVGGDFYDVIPLPNGRIGLVVGDVMGRGVRAAAVMGQLRAAVRSYCLEGHPPAALLTRLDRLVATLEEGLLVTAFYAEWDPGFGFALCSCAGHLPPLVRRPGEPAAYLEIDPGVPLGVGAQAYQEIEVPLPPGSLLLAYTDGLVEGPDLPVEDGMRQLAAAVTDAARAIEVCDAALHDLRPATGTRQYDDDIALLALVTNAEGSDSRPLVDPANAVLVDLPADYNSPARARAVVADTLHRWGLGSLVDVGTLLVSELVTNGVRHAGTGLRVTISRLGDSRVRVGVGDRAPGVQVRVSGKDTDAEGGRGLFLVEHLAAGWGSVVEGDGKTVWFELQA
ncbi:MAG TPA: SpoIIE family protein phosphatase [Mycobacteriales bacterium]|nr:SpoIIE family protein phosphatase [Mycobacteriales bacterium]